MVAATLMTPVAAAAQEDRLTWGVEPSSAFGPNNREHFVYSAEPGERIDDFVGVSNLSDRTLTFRVYASDAITTADGAFGLLPADRAPADVGSWVRFDGDRYTVPAGGRVDIPFSVLVPRDATPGDHTGGVLASIARDEQQNGRAITVDRRVGTRVYLRVNGPVRWALRLDRIDARASTPLGSLPGPTTVQYRLHNAGNVRASVIASLRVSGPLGVTLARIRLRRLPELLPGTTQTITERVAGVLPAGPLLVTVKVEPSASARAGSTDDSRDPMVVSGRASAWAMPWSILVVLVAVAAMWPFVARRRARAVGPARRLP